MKVKDAYRAPYQKKWSLTIAMMITNKEIKKKKKIIPYRTKCCNDEFRYLINDSKIQLIVLTRDTFPARLNLKLQSNFNSFKVD